MVYDVEINDEVLKNDAENIWESASRILTGCRDKFAEIDAVSFGCVPGMEEASALYNDSRAVLRQYYVDASEEFLVFERNLLQAVIIYKTHHNASQEEIDRLRWEIEN